MLEAFHSTTVELSNDLLRHKSAAIHFDGSCRDEMIEHFL
jgi:hypothetical protein